MKQTLKTMIAAIALSVTCSLSFGQTAGANSAPPAAKAAPAKAAPAAASDVPDFQALAAEAGDVRKTVEDFCSKLKDSTTGKLEGPDKTAAQMAKKRLNDAKVICIGQPGWGGSTHAAAPTPAKQASATIATVTTTNTEMVKVLVVGCDNDIKVYEAKSFNDIQIVGQRNCHPAPAPVVATTTDRGVVKVVNWGGDQPAAAPASATVLATASASGNAGSQPAANTGRAWLWAVPGSTPDRLGLCKISREAGQLPRICSSSVVVTPTEGQTEESWVRAQAGNGNVRSTGYYGNKP